jgi:2-hydroxy-6-oxonona-2,4-dienedioate hydrolase
VVWTRHDPTATVEDGERYAAAIPGARLEVLDDSSHLPQFEEPERFDELHLDFLARADATGRAAG